MGLRGTIVTAAAFAALGCSSSQQIDVPPLPPTTAEDAGTAEPDAARRFPDTGIGMQGLRVLRVEPDQGPFTGGNTAVVRGSGFGAEAVVTVGGRMVQPADTQLVDSHRLSIVLPAGEPGPADVVVQVGDDEAALDEGYTYLPVTLNPTRGSISGGTLITIDGSGITFEEGVLVYVGAQRCEDVTIVTDTRITCRTPASSAEGAFDVTIIQADGSDITIEDGFTYYNSADPFGGGLGGGPIQGSINLTVIDALTGSAVEGAFAIIGEDLSTEHQGYTNFTGQITFSGDDLVGSQTIHVAKHCYEKTSFVSFDATDVTVFLVPWQDLMCAMPGSGGGGGGSGRNGAFIEGELIWPGDFGADGIVPWDNVPTPRAGEQRVAYVHTTQRCPGDSPSCLNPPPSAGDSIHRVLEGGPTGEQGYPYSIFARPAAVAVYAIAGVESSRGEFTPYVMGVTRNVLAGPGERVENVDIIMNIPLDHSLDVRLEDLPSPARIGPDRYQVRAAIDLGGEGFIERRIGVSPLDLVTSRFAEERFRLFAQPALLGTLANGRYRVEARWVTRDSASPPQTSVVAHGVQNASEDLVLGDFLGIPQATSPAWDEPLPEDRMLRWEADGSEASYQMVLMVGGDGNPAWRHIVPGHVREAPIPDLSSMPDVDEISSGPITWMILSVRIPGHDFDQFSYADLSDRLWTGWASDLFESEFLP